MKRISDEDFEKAVADLTADPEAPEFRRIIEAAGRELVRRLDSEADDIPGSIIAKLYLDGQKALAAKQIPESDTTQVSILDRIGALPPEHAKALLEGEITRLTSLTTEYKKRLKTL